ncbi:hypothetical protein MTR67_031549 [Solanum verrucosum]|uniref:Uncharacterized protein n=2 Tax=Solanum verrucosum TaxID=315347 RepID=A0AAF0ZHS7_SOLVR|nr:hypothetical protein MTR67_031549 [Solanum verrucosum]
MATTVTELVWLKGLFSELGVEVTYPLKLFCDSKAATHIAAHPIFHERTKHIEIDCNFVRKKKILGRIDTHSTYRYQGTTSKSAKKGFV